jgi:hypothetical protein
MPNFQLSKPFYNSHAYYSLDDFAKGYVEAAFFTNGDTCDENENLLNDLGVERLTKKAVAKIANDCAQFQKEAADLLNQAYLRDYDDSQAGRDFWFNRQGHGVGFWDRKELEENELGEKLSEASKKFGEAYFYVERGWIHCD